MKKAIVIVVIIGMLGWAIYDFVAPESQDQTDAEPNGAMITSPTDDSDNHSSLQEGDMAPDFELETLDGEAATLSDYRGTPVMLNFWATWCGPCRAEMPDMEKFYQNEDVEILAVNLTSTESSMSDVEEFVTEYELTFPILLDEKKEVESAYRVSGYPTSYMINETGEITHISVGPMNHEQMVQELKEME
ncbi:thioredoxin [Gracilibacillus halophilus YIM-C55.5]|uniref:Thioredoxin n=1 Tax=Gracilibacillus halophilus YIM-C55.5 TaxID=1308866 RepID=N4W7S5_9BACI|nr:redoxin domain-containing protein [Gracilibacillus halophilus]ENH96323.1 thioredoxin [Gracilibacillus halophilus YIM-C55.5]